MLDKSPSYSNIVSAGLILLIAAIYAITSGVVELSALHYMVRPSLVEGDLSPLSAMLLRAQSLHPVTSHIAAAAIVVGGATSMMLTTIRHNLYGKATHLPLIIYLAYTAALTSDAEILAPAIAALLVSLSLSNLYDAYGQIDLNHRLFSGLFYLGCVVLIYPSTVVLASLLIVAVLFFENSGREMFVAVVGYFTPIVLHIYVMWLLGYALDEQMVLYRDAFMTSQDGFAGGLNTLIMVGLSLPVAIYAVYHIEEISITLMSRKRIVYSAVMLFLALPMLFVPSFTPSQLLLLAAPVSIITITAVAETNPRKAPILYIIVVAVILLSRFIPV